MGALRWSLCRSQNVILFVSLLSFTTACVKAHEPRAVTSPSPAAASQAVAIADSPEPSADPSVSTSPSPRPNRRTPPPKSPSPTPSLSAVPPSPVGPPGPPKTSSNGYPSKPPDPRVKLTFTLDRTSIRSGESAQGTLRAENTSVEFVDITHAQGCEGDWGLHLEDGTFVGGHEPYGCPGATIHDQLRPLETRTWTPLPLDAFYYEMRSDGYRAPLPTGTYQAAAGILTDGGIWFAPALTFVIER